MAAIKNIWNNLASAASDWSARTGRRSFLPWIVCFMSLPSTVPASSDACGGIQDAYVCDATDPSIFHICLGPNVYSLVCPDGLHFSAISQTCEWPEAAVCDQDNSSHSQERTDTRSDYNHIPRVENRQRNPYLHFKPANTESSSYLQYNPTNVQSSSYLQHKPKKIHSSSYLQHKPKNIHSTSYLQHKPKNIQSSSYLEHTPKKIQSNSYLQHKPKKIQSNSYLQHKPTKIQSNSYWQSRPKNIKSTSYLQSKPKNGERSDTHAHRENFFGKEKNLFPHHMTESPGPLKQTRALQQRPWNKNKASRSPYSPEMFRTKYHPDNVWFKSNANTVPDIFPRDNGTWKEPAVTWHEDSEGEKRQRSSSYAARELTRKRMNRDEPGPEMPPPSHNPLRSHASRNYQLPSFKSLRSPKWVQDRTERSKSKSSTVSRKYTQRKSTNARTKNTKPWTQKNRNTDSSAFINSWIKDYLKKIADDNPQRTLPSDLTQLRENAAKVNIQETASQGIEQHVPAALKPHWWHRMTSRSTLAPRSSWDNQHTTLSLPRARQRSVHNPSRPRGHKIPRKDQDNGLDSVRGWTPSVNTAASGRQRVGPKQIRPASKRSQIRAYISKYKLKLGQCDRSVCKLPTCRCVGTDIPGGLAVSQTPLMVLLTFDDSVTPTNFIQYKKIFNGSFTNPNGCPIKGTFFVSGDNTDYHLVQRLAKDGHEVASHSLSHRDPTTWWATAGHDNWEHEILGMRRRLEEKAGIPAGRITGMRAPFLQLGGDDQYSVLQENKFRYDSSMVTGHVYRQQQAPIWPFTLDSPPDSKTCSLQPCPRLSYPGLWEVPLIRWYGSNNMACAMPDACTVEPGAAGSRTFLQENFQRHLMTNRAPLGLFLHSSWFARQHGSLAALLGFLRSLSGRRDVWLVTVQQALDWIQRPLPLSAVASIPSWSC